MGKPTLKTISQLTGLAVPTVSRALNDAPDIRAETKALVRRTATEIGYVPNRAGVRLRTGRTNVISLVLSTEHDMMNQTAKLISSIAGALRDTPYHLIMTPYFPDEDPMKPIRYIVETGSADAVIFNQTLPEDPRVAYLLKRGFPFATHGRTAWADRHAWYDFDNLAFGRLAVNRLLQAGRRNLILIAPPHDQNYAIDMIAGARTAAETGGARLQVTAEVTSDSVTEATRAYSQDRLAEDPTVDGVISASTKAATAAISGMEAAGFDVGIDVDVVAKEAVDFLRLFRERIVVVHEDVRETGRFLAQAAIEAVRNPERPPMQHLEVPREF